MGKPGIQFIYGVKAPDWFLKQVKEERKTPINDANYHEGQGITLFDLHEVWDTLDAWYLDGFENPTGIVIGTNLFHFGDFHLLDYNDFDEEILSGAMEEIKECWDDLCQIKAIRELLENETIKPTLHIIYCE